MFGFGKKEAKTPEERLAELQKKRDWAGLVKAYYELEVSAMDGGDLNHAAAPGGFHHQGPPGH